MGKVSSSFAEVRAILEVWLVVVGEKDERLDNYDGHHGQTADDR